MGWTAIIVGGGGGVLRAVRGPASAEVVGVRVQSPLSSIDVSRLDPLDCYDIACLPVFEVFFGNEKEREEMKKPAPFVSRNIALIMRPSASNV